MSIGLTTDFVYRVVIRLESGILAPPNRAYAVIIKLGLRQPLHTEGVRL